MRKRLLAFAITLFTGCAVAAVLAGGLGAPAAHANNQYQTLPFTQNWANTNQITADNNWSGVPGIIGYDGRNDALTTKGIDPRTVLADTTLTSNVYVSADRNHPSIITDKAVAEFEPGYELDFSVVGIRASTEFDAPFLLFHINTSGRSNIMVAYRLIDLDASGRNAITPVALQYRVGNSGNFTNVEAGYVADATDGPSVAGKLSNVSALLPAAANNQAQVQFRILTTNAEPADEWVGIQNISVTGDGGGGPTVPPPTVDPNLTEKIYLPLVQR